MADIRRVGDSGIHTVEGQVSGSRAAELSKQRDKDREEYETAKKKMKDSKTKVGDIGSKFTGTTDAAEQEFRRRTIGLVTADDFRKAREVVESAARADQEELEAREAAERDAAKRARAKKRKKTAAALSFADDDGDEEKEEDGGDDAIPIVEKKKNPHVDTSHLPDKERDLLRAQEHERLALEWKKEQDIIRQHKLEVTFAYHDGSGHRKTLVLTKGSTIGQFLHKVKVAMQDDFKELKTASADTLMYVKEDLIIPNTISFYDLIVTKARGKSGPLFHFDVHDDIRLTHDSRVEKDESHPGKVVGRWWYEKNKHIFPASRWERYEPTLQRDGPYTVHGGEVRGEVSKKKSADKKKYGEESVS